MFTSQFHSMNWQNIVTNLIGQSRRIRPTHRFTEADGTVIWEKRLKARKRTSRRRTRCMEKICVEFGIDHPLINAFPVLNSVPEDDRAVELMYAYNDYLLENYLDKYDQFLGLCTVATQDPAAAAEEINRMGSERDIEGLYRSTAAHNRRSVILCTTQFIRPPWTTISTSHTTPQQELPSRKIFQCRTPSSTGFLKIICLLILGRI